LFSIHFSVCGTGHGSGCSCWQSEYRLPVECEQPYHADKLYVQVCYLLSDEATIKREFGSLLDVRDNYPKLVLYKEGSFRGNYEGIPAIRIEDWLAEKNV
jgi:hypothetical protein